MQHVSITNLVRGTTFFQHAGIALLFVFMPIIAKGVTDSLFEIGIIIAAFSFSQILSEIYFGRISDRKGTRIQFIRIGFIGCAITFGLHYFADDAVLLLLARIGAGITTGIMIPAMIAYSYEVRDDKRKVASIISFHALGWLAGIVAAGIVNDEKGIFLVSSAFFLMGLIITIKLPNIPSKKELEPGTTKRIISKKQIPFSFSFDAAHWRISSLDYSSIDVNGCNGCKTLRDINSLCCKHRDSICYHELDGR